jgi:hypothetical protein
MERREEAAKLMETLFDIPCRTAANFLNLVLTSSNQMRYYANFHDWDGCSKRDGFTLYGCAARRRLADD